MRSGLFSRKRILVGALVLGFAVLLSVWQQDRLYPYAALLLPLDAAPAATIPELTLEAKIPLGPIKGRIDHLAFDPTRTRLFIAELGNNTVSVVDVHNRKVETRLTGLAEPQGIGFAAQADALFIANGGDGVVEMRRGSDLVLLKRIKLSGDADNIRMDEHGQALVGYGDGAIAVLDATAGDKKQDISLAAHPESFQLDHRSQRIFVNEPKALRIAVVDRQSGKEIGRWGTSGAAANFPMALDAEGERLFVAYRLPALLTTFDIGSGELIDRQATCGDADDIFADSKRRRVYVVCGDGSLAVLDTSEKKPRELSRLATRPGARTGLYAIELDLLFVAVPARGEAEAQIWVCRPN